MPNWSRPYAAGRGAERGSYAAPCRRTSSRRASTIAAGICRGINAMKGGIPEGSPVAEAAACRLRPLGAAVRASFTTGSEITS